MPQPDAKHQDTKNYRPSSCLVSENIINIFIYIYLLPLIPYGSDIYISTQQM